MTKQPASCSLRKVRRFSAVEGRAAFMGNSRAALAVGRTGYLATDAGVATGPEKAPTSVIVALEELLRDALIFDRRLQNHAAAKLIHHGALDFLPRCLARRIMVAAAFLQSRSALRQFGRRNQDVGGSLVEIDAHVIAGLQQRKPAARCRFGRCIED